VETGRADRVGRRIDRRHRLAAEVDRRDVLAREHGRVRRASEEINALETGERRGIGDTIPNLQRTPVEPVGVGPRERALGGPGRLDRRG
jgi:hypothetical protein